MPLPFCLPGQAVCVTPRDATAATATAATSLLFLARLGLRVAVGPGAAVAVAVSPRYRNGTCGLCGNFDGRPADDRLHPAGATACHRRCPGAACPRCHQPPERTFLHEQLCGLLRLPEGPFGACHLLVPAGTFSAACLRELCEAPEDPALLQRLLAEVLGAYDAACRHAGAWVGPWSVPSLCRELGTGGGGRGGCPPWASQAVTSSPCVRDELCVSTRDVLHLSAHPPTMFSMSLVVHP